MAGETIPNQGLPQRPEISDSELGSLRAHTSEWPEEAREWWEEFEEAGKRVVKKFEDGLLPRPEFVGKVVDDEKEEK